MPSDKLVDNDQAPLPFDVHVTKSVSHEYKRTSVLASPVPVTVTLLEVNSAQDNGDIIAGASGGTPKLNDGIVYVPVSDA